jgi:triacylglycerol lipase
MNLVFASGFLVPQQFLQIHYFRDVKDHVERAGHRAAMPPVPPLGTCDERAQALAQGIAREFPNGPIHIIAHSMGGLDSRTLIGNDIGGLAGRIASLTTLSTPHGGSPVADLLAGERPDDARRVFYDGISDALKRIGLATGALGNLTKERASQVPDAARIRPQIRYRSYAATGRLGLLSTSFLLAPFHHYIHFKTGQANDGLVAEDSAKYGDFQKTTLNCDHADIVGYNLDTAGLGPPVFGHLAQIDAIIAQL